MKAKIAFYATMPNVAKFRSRVANPSKDLTAQIRTILTSAVVDTVNENILGIRAKFIEALAGAGINYTSEAQKAKVESIFESFFDVIASVDKGAAEPEAEETPLTSYDDDQDSSEDPKAADWE